MKHIKRSLFIRNVILFFIMDILEQENRIFITFKEEYLQKKKKKIGRTFFLDKCLSFYIAAGAFVSPGNFFHSTNLKIAGSRFLVKICIEFGLKF